MNKKGIIIETTRNLFTNYGYKKVSMDKIATSTKVAKKKYIIISKIRMTYSNILLPKNLKVLKNVLKK